MKFNNPIQEAVMSKSSLQFGFTAGFNPYFASIMLTEAIATRGNSVLFVATLDAMKAFDVVDHTILAHKMYQDGLTGALWMLKKNSYDQLTGQVKWDDQLGSIFKVEQGTKQGGIASTSDYKSYVNSLLTRLERSGLGMSIGNAYIGAPTCADDILLISQCPSTLQSMLNIVANYADSHRYQIHPVKSTITIFSTEAERRIWAENSPWHIHGECLSVTNTVTHLGLIRNAATPRSMMTIHIEGRINLARRTAYSLMGAGMHGLNGLHPAVSMHLYRTYVLPRLLSGLETVILSAKELDPLELFHRRILRAIQHLPDKCSNTAVYVLLGTLPIEAHLHNRMLTMFGAIARAETSRIHTLAISMLENPRPQSWFTNISILLQKYKLQEPGMTLKDPPTKSCWKRIVSRAIWEHWEEKLKRDMTQKSSLKYLLPENCTLSRQHLLWESTSYNPRDIRRAVVKAKLLTGTYILQANRARFNQHEVNPTCPLCGEGSEDREHFLLNCARLEGIRKPYVQSILKTLPDEIIQQGAQDILLQIILDCPISLGSTGRLSRAQRSSIETTSRGLCYALHFERANILCYRP